MPSGGPAGGAGSPALVVTPQEKGRVGGGGWPKGGDPVYDLGRTAGGVRVGGGG